jgi:hypothetical protein
MLVACSTLLQTLAALKVAAAIGVTGVCPGYLQIQGVFPGQILDFSQSTGLNRLDVVGINGLTIEGFKSVSTEYSAINIINSQRILVNQPRIISPGTAGISIQGSTTVEVSGAWITGSNGDGIDVAGSVNVNIHDGACEGNVPGSTAHPACLQVWSVSGYPITHMLVQRMTVIGQTEGFDVWDQTNLGATDVQFLNNHAAITELNCLGVSNVASLVVSGNDCHSLPGGKGPPVINIQSDPNANLRYNTLGLPLAEPID